MNTVTAAGQGSASSAMDAATGAGRRKDRRPGPGCGGLLCRWWPRSATRRACTTSDGPARRPGRGVWRSSTRRPPRPTRRGRAAHRPGAARQAEHVLGDEVAVSVDDPAVGDPVGQQRAAPGEEPACQVGDPFEYGRGEDPLSTRRQLGEVAFHRVPSAARSPSASVSALRSARAWKATSSRARARRSSWTSAPERASAASRRSSGIRRITRTGSAASDVGLSSRVGGLGCAIPR